MFTSRKYISGSFLNCRADVLIQNNSHCSSPAFLPPPTIISSPHTPNVCTHTQKLGSLHIHIQLGFQLKYFRLNSFPCGPQPAPTHHPCSLHTTALVQGSLVTEDGIGALIILRSSWEGGAERKTER